MKGAGVCSLNREVHYIMWSLNRVSGVLRFQLLFESRHLSLGISIVFSLELFSFSILDTIQEYSRISKTEFLFHFSMN